MVSLVLADRVQLQGHHVQSHVPAAPGVRGTPRRHLGPERQQDAARAAGDRVCRCPASCNTAFYLLPLLKSAYLIQISFFI